MNRVLSDDDRQRVNRAVQQAESVTSAEIVPVVARSSGRYDRAEDIVGLWCAALAMSIVWLLFPLPGVEPGSWEAPSPAWQLASMLAAAIVGFTAGAVLGTRLDWLRRLFTPRAQMRDEVNRRAREVFFDKRVHHTRAGSGVLLYVSLFEHLAVVLADQGVLDRLGPGQIEEWCRAFTEHLHTGDIIGAICDTTAAVGDRLASALPRPDGDSNELPNALIVID